jgi:hypothetical protein
MPTSPNQALDPAVDPDHPSNFAMDPATDIPACAGQSECFAFTIDTRLIDDGTTTGTDTDFAIPTSGYVGGTDNSYSWTIDWGDGSTPQTVSGTGDTSAGITHDYSPTGGAGKYRITIRPDTTATDGWFNAFGFNEGTSGANAHTNKYKFLSINTPFTNLMRSTNSSYRFAFIFCYTRNAIGIPANLFTNIRTDTTTDFSSMFIYTFNSFARNSTIATIPQDLFTNIDTSNGTDFSRMFFGTFSNFAPTSPIATIPQDLFDSINTSKGTDFSYMFYQTFYSFAYNSSIATIPQGLFDNIYTRNGTNFESMFYGTFSYFAYNSLTATIPQGIFDHIDTSKGTNFRLMFCFTFSYFAYTSPIATIPPNLFDKIDTSKGTSFYGMFASTFYNYATRQATFNVSGSIVETQTFNNPYSVKVSSDNTPSNSPTVTAGDKAYPTYNSTTRSITAPTGTYSNYIWYTKDGTSCDVQSPTTDCGPQDTSTKVTLPLTYWTPDMSTETGNITLYSIEDPYFNLSFSSNNITFSNIIPGSAAQTITASHTVTVTTNNPSGYTIDLSIAKKADSCDGTTTSLTTTNNNQIPTTTNPWISGGAASTTLQTNTWGFNLNSSTTNFIGIAPCNNPQRIKTTTTAQPTPNGETTTITYGARIDRTISAGVYTGTVVYTVLAGQ